MAKRNPGFSIHVEGLDVLKRAFGEGSKKLAAAQKAALNRTARAIKAELADEMSGTTGLRKGLVNARLTIYPASDRYPTTARLIPNSHGIPAAEYRYRAEPVDASGTRARIRVAWPGGAKVAGGFINPRARGRLPLRTYVKYRGRIARRFSHPQEAIGPSLAALFKALVTASRRVAYRERLKIELEKELQ